MLNILTHSVLINALGRGLNADPLKQTGKTKHPLIHQTG